MSFAAEYPLFTIMAVVTSNPRMALSTLTDSDLNVTRNSPGKLARLQRANSFLHSTPIKPRKRPFLELHDSNWKNDPYDVSEEVTPRLKRARIIKMKLQVAWYKVKTNQTTTPLGELKFPRRSRPSSPTKKSMLELAASKVYRTLSPAESSPLLGERMDDIVAKRSLQNRARVPPASAPASQTTFNSILSSTGTAKSNKFSLEFRAGTQGTQGTQGIQSPQLSQFSQGPLSASATDRFKLPPVSNLLSQIQSSQSGPGETQTESQSQVTVSDSQNPQESQDQHDRDATIEHVTPVRASARKTHDYDATQTQIWSSPLQTTPSSIGAARCLLQLAHR